MRELTERQTTFLQVLFHEADGNLSKAKTLAGYNEKSSVSTIVRSMKDEILEMTKEYMALNAPKAAVGLATILDSPSELGNQHKLSAAKEILDRVGIHKTDKVELSTPTGVMILTPKESHGL